MAALPGGARLVVRIPVTMSAVRANGTTTSYDCNTRTGQEFNITLTADTSAAIRELEANNQGLSRDQMYARAPSAIQDLIRNKNTRMDYNGQEEHYLEDQDGCDDPNDPGEGGSVSYGVPRGYLDNLQVSMGYLGVTSNAPASVLGRLLQGAIRAPDSMYRKQNSFVEAWGEAPERGELYGYAALLGCKREFLQAHGNETATMHFWMQLPAK